MTIVNNSSWAHRITNISVLLLVQFILANAQQANAHAFTFKPTTGLINDTVTRIAINLTPPGTGFGGLYSADHFKITYTDEETGKPVTKFLTVDKITGGTSMYVQAKAGTVVVTNLDEPSVLSQFAQVQIFDPPNNHVVTAFGVDSGSSVTLAGNSYALSGSFTATETGISYDPASANYGVETGFVDASVQGTGSGGQFTLLVNSAPLQTDLTSIWNDLLVNNIDIPSGGLSTVEDFGFSGMLDFNSNLTPFSGTFNGDVTFFADGSTTASGALTLDTAFGEAVGSISGLAQPHLVAEPSSLYLAGLALVGLGLGRERRLNLRYFSKFIFRLCGRH